MRGNLCVLSISIMSCFSSSVSAAQSEAELNSAQHSDEVEPLELSLPSLLPTPAGLERDVQFWERIFSDYSPDQCVFHDEWNLDVVYYVANVPRTYGSGGNPLLKRHLKALRTALQSISLRGRPLGEFEEKIYASIPQKLRSPDFFKYAEERVRCQRGVEFQPSMKRSLSLLPKIKAVLQKKGLPEDLAYLPHLESGFDRFATSKCGAKGLWQFMAQTARSEGLKVKRGNDWRTDPDRATDAATDYLASIFLKVRSWELAITSYNYGPNGIIRAVQKYGANYMKIRQEHRSKIFGFAARNYYPSFLAVRNVAIRQEKRLALGETTSATLADGDEVRKKSKTF